MRILFIGDVMGRSGRDALAKHLPMLKSSLKPDVIIVNGENAAHGIGITADICKEFISQAFALRRALNQAGNINKFNCRRDYFF